jgi:serine/threonine protein kinase
MEPGAKMITMQLLEGLDIMHEMGFSHRDLKPQVGHIWKFFTSSTVSFTKKSDTIVFRTFLSLGALLSGG